MPKKKCNIPLPKLRRDSFSAISQNIMIRDAIKLHISGNLSEAKKIYEKLISLYPNNSDALHLLGVIYHQNKNFDYAIKLINSAIIINPNNSAYYSNLGLSLQELGKVELAINSYRNALKINPNFIDACYNMGNALKDMKDYKNSFIFYNKVLVLNPNYPKALCNRGFIHLLNKDYTKALEDFDNAISINPLMAEAYSNRGISLKELGFIEDAISSFDKAIKLNLNYYEAHINRSNLLKDQKFYSEAITGYNFAIKINPNSSEAFLNRSIAYQEINLFEEAFSDLNKALLLNPNYPEAYFNRALISNSIGNTNSSIDDYLKALTFNPNYVEALSNLGIIYKDLNDYETSLFYFNKAINIKSDYPEPYWNKSLLLLLNSNLIEGFKLYEWRFLEKDSLRFRRIFDKPLWLGKESIRGKRILIYSEQGLGDTIQFCRYIRLVASLGANVIFEVQKPLYPLLHNLIGTELVISKGDLIPDFDFQCPLLSLPLAFKTDLDSIPSQQNYINIIPERISRWNQRLTRKVLNIGISWQGNQGKVDIGRSYKLLELEKIANLSKVELISLQKGYGTEQLDNLPDAMKVTDFGNELDSDGAFMDTAGLMKNLDLVITSDTAVAHLAGALGIKTWLVLKFIPDWRWLLARSDSPWYPTITLYRQQSPGDWSSVFDKIYEDLSILNEQYEQSI
jgi:tetratricopeptide (TPR) repeat protein